jgi:hypothetical protein
MRFRGGGMHRRCNRRGKSDHSSRGIRHAVIASLHGLAK